MKREYRHQCIMQEMISVMKSSLKIVKRKNNFLIKQNISFLNKNIYSFILGKVFFKITKNSIASIFCFMRQIQKIVDIPWQKP